VRLSGLPSTELAHRLREGLCWRVGPYAIRFRTSLSFIAHHLGMLYADFPILDQVELIDAHVSVRAAGWLRRRASIFVDGTVMYRKAPISQAVPLVEWTLNLCVFHRPSPYLLLHAAGVERDGLAAIFPGDAGSGKSTLCAALVHRGWRLLSDEVAPLDAADGRIVPVPRPISLKEESIEAIRAFAPQAPLGPTWPETAKGRLAHVLPPRQSVLRMDEPAEPAWMVFPSFKPAAAVCLEPLHKGEALLHCATNAFNYNVLGTQGFTMLAGLIDRCDCYRLSYGRLDEAVAALGDLWAARSEAAKP
jgi:HprK-related kinase A